MRLVQTIENGEKVAKVYRNSEWNEYVVRFYIRGVHETTWDFHTDHKVDAVTTAKAWAGVPIE